MPAAHSGVYWLTLAGNFVKANRILGHEGCVVQTFTDDDIEHCQVKRQVRAGTDGQPIRCFSSGLGKARIQIDQLHSAVNRMDQLARLGV